MIDYYDRGGNPLPGDWYDTDKHDRNYQWTTERRVAATIVGDVTVSTVWLGLDHSPMGSGPPRIFETQIFGGPWEYELERYTTEEDALRGHLDALDRLRAGKPPFDRLEDGDDE